MIGNFHKVLVLCPHPDDEIGCAGLISRLVNMKKEVKVIFFSDCQDSLPPGVEPRHLRWEEAKKSMQILGVNYYSMLDFRVRNFSKDRQRILDKLVYLCKHEYKGKQPHLVLLPCGGDMHQDHEVVHKEGLRAFKHTNILGYEMPQNLLAFRNTAFVALTEGLLEQKIQAIKCHKSQQDKSYTSSEFIESLAKVRGMQAGMPYAEAFEVIRLIL